MHLLEGGREGWQHSSEEPWEVSMSLILSSEVWSEWYLEGMGSCHDWWLSPQARVPIESWSHCLSHSLSVLGAFFFFSFLKN